MTQKIYIYSETINDMLDDGETEIDDEAVDKVINDISSRMGGGGVNFY